MIQQNKGTSPIGGAENRRDTSKHNRHFSSYTHRTHKTENTVKDKPSDKHPAQSPNREQKPRQDRPYSHGRRGGQKSREARPRMSRKSIPTAKNLPPIPGLEAGTMRIIPLGGVEEIGKNITVFEYGNDIFVVDMGFQFSEDDTPGIDYILPNTKYLEERKDRIRAVFITHGHLDHVGAIPYLMEKIGNPPMYARNFTALMIKKRQEEFPHLQPLNIHIVENGTRLKIGEMFVKFFAVTHAIPDSMGIVFETPHGDVVHTGDIRLDHIDGDVSEIEEEIYNSFKERNVLALLADSTNAENPGFSISEKIVYQNIEEIIKNTKGRLILSTFASQVERMLKMIEISEKYGKKIVIEGRSMKTNIEVTKAAGLLKIGKESLISAEEMNRYPENKQVALVTGAQGEEFAALMRIANKTHKHIKISPRDTILMSSSIVPGNERNVQKLKDNLSRQGAHIIHYKNSDIHSSGHANSEELAWIHAKIHPKFFVPIHGYHYMLRVHADIAKRIVPETNIIIPDNGMVIEISKGEKIAARKEVAQSNPILVDGFSIGDAQEVVLRDRQMLSQDGMFVVIASIDTKTGKLRKSPDIISRGFVYLRESQELLRDARVIVKKTIEKTTAGMNPINFEHVKNTLTDDVSRFLFQKTNKRPIVIPVLLGT
jgi:ribonuclease J